MSKKLESRREIETGIEKRKRSVDDRAKHMELVVKEKKNIADASRQLRLSTTSEGADAVMQAIKEAAQATHQEFQKQNTDIEKRFGECKKAEQDLLQRTKAAKSDASKAGAAAKRVKETKEAEKLLTTAEKAATTDGEFTDKQGTRQKKERTGAEQRRSLQKQQLVNTTLAW